MAGNPNKWEVYVHGGRTATGIDAVEWAVEAARRGAGEILLTSMDRDGSKDGFDCALTRAVARAVDIPVIASGGVASLADIERLAPVAESIEGVITGRAVYEGTLDVAEGEVVSIVGASGAGKTTLLQIVGTLSRPDAGRVEIDGQDAFSLGDKALSRFRNERIGFVFQFHHLLPEFTAFENVCIPGFIGRRPRAEVERRAAELLEMMNLTPRRGHKPGQLSGGEQQRVAIARALVNSPAVLLADEPSGNLDSHNRDEIHRLFFELRDRLGQTVVIVTHDEHLAAMADRKITMSDGRIL